MTKIKNLVRLAAAFFLTSSLILHTSSLFADSFQATNLVQNAVAILGYPTNALLLVTNSSGSNYVGTMNGLPVAIPNHGGAGGNPLQFYMTGTGSNTNKAGVLTVQLIRAYKSNPQVIMAGVTTYTTNNSVITTNYTPPEIDWETTPSLTLTLTAGGPYPVTMVSNLDTYAGAAAALGIYSITNNDAGATTQVFTNCDFGVVKKILPIRFP
ncbi:exported hypothetical protein [Verrucomicrobia bacterium]|nr:exported hypothetical protein [Verrucomicrobiota bacterium]